MKIGNPADKAVTGTTTPAKTEGASTPTRTPGKAEGLDGGVEASAKVSLSPMADTMMTGNDPTFDAAKVERVKQAIADGTYKVNHEAIADKLIANAQEVLGRR